MSLRTRITVVTLFCFCLLCMATMSATAKVKAKNAPAAVAACGNSNTNFDIRNDSGPAPSMHAPANKALVFVVADFPKEIIKPIEIRVGLDGKWVGATHSRSYMSFAVSPGLHHLCVRYRGRGWNFQDGIELEQLNAVAGSTYFFRARATAFGGQSFGTTLMQTVNEDEGALLIQTSDHTLDHTLSRPK